MTVDSWIVLGIIVIAFILFIWEKIPSDLVAILIMVSLAVTEVLDVSEAISGFSNPATLTVAFMFVVSAAILNSGVMQLWGPKFSNTLQKSYRKGMISLMLAVAVCSAFINNTPVVAIFIPVILQVSKSTGIPSSKMLIPLSFGSILGGMCTLLGTSTNILVSGLLEDAGLEGLGMFQMTPVSIVVLIIGVLFFYLVGFKLLPSRKSSGEELRGDANFLTEIKLTKAHPTIGKQIMESDWLKLHELELVEIQRGNESYILPAGDMTLNEGDLLKLNCSVERLKELKSQPYNQFVEADGEDKNDATSIVELVVSSQSNWEGKSLKEIDFRRTYRAFPLAIRHRDEVVKSGLNTVELKAGDVIVAQMKRHFVKQLRRNQNSGQEPVILASEENFIAFNRKSFIKVLSILIAMILLASFGVPMVIAVLGAASALVLIREMRMKDMYRAVNWSIVFLMAGAISLGVAMEKSGLAHTVASFMVDNLSDFGPRYLLAGLFVLTMVLTEIMSNTAAAALMTPLALSVSVTTGLSPTPFAIGIMLAASASFITPIGYQTNTMVYAAGSYKFKDFAKVGIGLSLVVAIICITLIPFFFPF